MPILEIGCGTGAILREYSNLFECIGIDLNHQYLLKSKQSSPLSIPICADGYSLPFKTRSFSIVFCHFLLLWTKDPMAIISEMIRVTIPNGFIALFAEPDYTPKIDMDPETKQLLEIQIAALRQEGADPFIGEKIKTFLDRKIFKYIHHGRYHEIKIPFINKDIKLEKSVFKHDLQVVRQNKLSTSLSHHKYLSKNKIPFSIDTYYAFGQVRSE